MIFLTQKWLEVHVLIIFDKIKSTRKTFVNYHIKILNR